MREPVGSCRPRRNHGSVDDLTELVERAAAAEKSALSSKWKEESDVRGLIRRTRKTAEEQRQEVVLIG